MDSNRSSTITQLLHELWFSYALSLCRILMIFSLKLLNTGSELTWCISSYLPCFCLLYALRWFSRVQSTCPSSLIMKKFSHISYYLPATLWTSAWIILHELGKLNDWLKGFSDSELEWPFSDAKISDPVSLGSLMTVKIGTFFTLTNP